MDVLESNTTGNFNTGAGFVALAHNTTGGFNTAVGGGALQFNTSGGLNTAIGANALNENSTGTKNTAIGQGALLGNNGDNNTANGFEALIFNSTGSNNTASGTCALESNTTGSNNLANGFSALFRNTTGNNNMATGANALFANTTGFFNMANGSFAMVHNSTGNFNVAEGLNALFSNTTGSSNIAIGTNAGGDLTTGNGNIDIGNRGLAGESRTIRLGTSGTQTNVFIAGVNGVAVPGGVGVIIDANGHFGTVVSSARFKKDIKPMDKASEAIFSLKPVTFHYKNDNESIPQFGLVAEEVENIDPDLVARGSGGKTYGVRYEAVNAMLLNEFLKEHRKMEAQVQINREQETTIKELKSALGEQQKQISALTWQVQKVSASLETGKSTLRLANNTP